MSRRLLIAALLGLLLFSTPALAGLSVTDQQRASTDLTTGPQFYAFDTGTDLSAGVSTGWDGFTLEGLAVDAATGELVLGRAGDVAPSTTPWHDEASTTRACETEAAQSVRALTLDVDREVEAGRMQANLADIRAYVVAGTTNGEVADGVAVPVRTGTPDATSVVVDTTNFDEPVAVCVYWGNLAAASASDPTVQGPVIADGGWSWRVWENAGDGLSLDLVDWSSPSASGTVPSGAVPADVCNQCANELVGFLTPTVSGSYRFFISADDVGRFEIAPLDDPAALAIVIDLSVATPQGDFSDPAQASAPIGLEADQVYAIRARSKDLEDGDHLEIAWALDGDAPAILPTVNISAADGTPGALTHRRFDVVATTDRSGPPSSVARLEASETVPNSGDQTANSISGYVVVPEAGDYRFWISSDDEGSLRVATNGNPASASRVAWLTNFTEQDNWTADPSQHSAVFALEAGQVLWIEASNRDRGGPDHLQVGWSRDDTDPVTAPDLLPAEVLSENPPLEAVLPTAALGSVEGQQSVVGAFISPALDASAGGSNVFGEFERDSVGDVDINVSFASSIDGPWSSPVDLVDGAAAPLNVDGLRYVRFTGSIRGDDDSSPSVTEVGVERDLVEAVATDATSTVVVDAVGDETVLRVRGSIGAPATARIVGTGGSAAFTLSTASSTGVEEAPFGNGESHQIVVSVVPGSGTATARWTVVDGRGAIVVHDIVVVTS